MQRTPSLPRLALAAALALALAGPGAQAASFAWNSGTFVAGVTAPSPLGAGDVLDIGAGGFKFFSGAVSNFTNGGTVNWNADPLFVLAGAAVVNNALWNAASDNDLLYNGGAAPSFTNNGTLRKTAGLGATTINNDVGFVNNGTLDAQVGRLAFVGGSVFNAGSVFSGAGLVTLVGGTNTFNGNFSSSSLLLSGGTHQGNGAVLNGVVALAGGVLSGGWQVATGQTLNGANGGFKFIGGAGTVVDNRGTVAWNTGDALFLQGGATLNNQGLFSANASTLILYNGGAAPAFNNQAGGTVRAAGGQTLTIENGVGFVNNGGVLDAQAGAAIRYNGGSVFNAGSQFTGAGRNLATGNNQFNGVVNSANLELSGGRHAGNAALIGGSVDFTGGTLSGTWGVAAGQTLKAGSGGFKFIGDAGTVLSNQGTIAWNTTDGLFLLGGAALSNQGLFVANADAGLFYNGGAAPRFDNMAAGVVRVAPGKTLTVNDGVGFVNNGGVLDAQAGATLQYTGGSVFNAGTQFTGAGRNLAVGNNAFNGALQSQNLVLAAGMHLGQGAVLNGTAAFAGGSLTGTWQVAPGQTLTALDGPFKFIAGAATRVTNQGALNWDAAGNLFLQEGGVFVNQGVLNFNADAGVFYNGGSSPSFVNQGLIAKTGGASGTTISDNLGFSNLGTIDVRVGTIVLPTNFDNQGRLMGTGSLVVAGTLGNAGTVAPGASPGTLSLTGNFAQAAAGTFEVDLQSLASHDLFNITGTAALSGRLALHCWSACGLAVGDVVTILDSAGDLSGSFASVTLTGFGSGAFDVVYDRATDRVQLVVTQTVSAVPEPGSWALWLAGCAALAAKARRRRG